MRVGIMGTGVTFHDDLETAILAEELGFDSFFLPEHHQQPYWPSAPLITLAGIASRTSRIRLGTGVMVMGLHNPVRLAEETATLDGISGGRLILGLGMGYQESDFAALGAPLRQRVSLLDEGLEVLRRAWTERPFSYSGRRFHFDSVSAYPAPVQKPHPPVWLAAWTVDGVRRAASVADGWLTDPIHGTEAIATLAAEYRRAAREAGREPFIALMRQFAIAEDAGRAAALYGEMVASVWRYYHQNRSFNLDLEPRWREIADAEAIDWEMVVPGRVPFGDPKGCLDGFRESIEAIDPQYIVAVPTPSGGGPEAARNALRLFGEAVLPHVTGGET
jgi:probable F420-dependent oxidoreductase